MAQLRPLLHPMIVHFPIALLLVSVVLDWAGYWLKHPNLTRAGFYTLVLGAMGAGVAALSGPDHIAGDPSVSTLLTWHQSFASLTVALAVSMTAIRFLATDGIRGIWARCYLVCTLALLFAVSATGYFGGEMTYHHAVGVTGANVPSPVTAQVHLLIPAKVFVALVGLLAVVGFCCWIALGRRLAPVAYAAWREAAREEFAHSGGQIWTLQRGRPAIPRAARPPMPMRDEAPERVSARRF